MHCICNLTFCVTWGEHLFHLSAYKHVSIYCCIIVLLYLNHGCTSITLLVCIFRPLTIKVRVSNEQFPPQKSVFCLHKALSGSEWRCCKYCSYYACFPVTHWTVWCDCCNARCHCALYGSDTEPLHNIVGNNIRILLF